MYLHEKKEEKQKKKSKVLSDSISKFTFIYAFNPPRRKSDDNTFKHNQIDVFNSVICYLITFFLVTVNNII